MKPERIRNPGASDRQLEAITTSRPEGTRGANGNPQRAGIVEGGLPDRTCSCRETQRLSVPRRWSAETVAQEMPCYFLLLALESLVGASYWLDPGGRSPRQGTWRVQPVRASSLRAQSSAAIIVGNGGDRNNQQTLPK